MLSVTIKLRIAEHVSREDVMDTFVLHEQIAVSVALRRRVTVNKYIFMRPFPLLLVGTLL